MSLVVPVLMFHITSHCLEGRPRARSLVRADSQVPRGYVDLSEEAYQPQEERQHRRGKEQTNKDRQVGGEECANKEGHDHRACEECADRAECNCTVYPTCPFRQVA